MPSSPATRHAALVPAISSIHALRIILPLILLFLKSISLIPSA
nr:MAG TPA: hypothetical protein [Caudoviricetes sp.]